MNILLIGSGGREHALAYKIAQSPKLTKLFIAPGNAGTDSVGENINISVNDFESFKHFAIQNNIKMVIVGPEEPLVKGIHDFFKDDPNLSHISVIGPDSLGAQLEGSKDFAKQFMFDNNIPTAKSLTVTENTIYDGIDFLATLSPPYVLKADGLAAGKGVLILRNINEAIQSLHKMLGGQFGEASKKVVIEEYLNGIELSCFVLTDGENYVMFPEAKDYKRIGEGDTGLNTGGMGAVSPVSFANKEFLDKVEEEVIKPTLQGLKKENITYKGFIFFGLMNVNNKPYVIEYNVRMGDPESQVVLPRIENDFIDLFQATAEQKLDQHKIKITEDTVCTVVMVSGGYPDSYSKGLEISGLDRVIESTIFHAGTKFDNDSIVTNGGRVLAISSFGKTMEEALQKSYKSIELIEYENKYFRKDIGFDL